MTDHETTNTTLDAAAVRAEAARRRLPLYALAIRVRLDPATFSRVLNGRRAPSAGLANALERVLGLTPGALANNSIRSTRGQGQQRSLGRTFTTAEDLVRR